MIKAIILVGFAVTLVLGQEVVQNVPLPSSYWSQDIYVGNYLYVTNVYNADVVCVTARIFEGTPMQGNLRDYRKVEVSNGQLFVFNCTSEDCTSCNGTISLDLTKIYPLVDNAVKFNVNTAPEFISGSYVVIAPRNSSKCGDLTNPEGISQIALVYPGCFLDVTSNSSQRIFCNATGLYGAQCPPNQCDCIANRITELSGCAIGTYNACLIKEEEPPNTPVATMTSFGSVLKPEFLTPSMFAISISVMLGF